MSILTEIGDFITSGLGIGSGDESFGTVLGNLAADYFGSGTGFETVGGFGGGMPATGVTRMPAVSATPIPGYHLERRGLHAGQYIRNRHMDPMNYRALKRATRRLVMYERANRHVQAALRRAIPPHMRSRSRSSRVSYGRPTGKQVTIVE